MTIANLEVFAIQFAKLVDIQEQVDIQKQFDIDVQVQGNSALADAKAEATALGPNTHTETLGLTSTTAIQGVGSSCSYIAESLSLTTRHAEADCHVGCVAFQDRPALAAASSRCRRQRTGRGSTEVSHKVVPGNDAICEDRALART